MEVQKITRISRASLVGAPALKDALVAMFARIDMVVQHVNAQQPAELPPKEVVVCLVGHNIAACDLDYIWSACNRHGVAIPLYFESYWCTLNAVKKCQTSMLNDKVFLSKFPHAPPSHAGHSVSALYLKAKVIAAGGDFQRAMEEDLSVNAHGSIFDVKMTAHFATQPKFWKLRKQKAAGRRTLAPIWERKAEAHRAR